MTGPSSRVPVLLVLVWLGGLLAATSVGLLAVRLVAAQVGDPAVAPLSAVAAASAAAAPSSAPSSGGPSPDGTASRTTTGPTTHVPTAAAPTATAPPVRSPVVATGTRTFTTAAGALGVQCAGTSLRLLYATPAPGYALDERSVSGPEAQVRFEGAGTRVRVRLSCATGAPQLVGQRTDSAGEREVDEDQDDRVDEVDDVDGEDEEDGD